MINKPTDQEIERGYKECECGAIILLQSGYEVSTSSCTKCGEHVASREEFFKPLNGVYII